MVKSISEDLRWRLIAAVDGGLSRRAAAERFDVAAASAVRRVREWRKTGSTNAKPQGGDMRSRRIEAIAMSFPACSRSKWTSHWLDWPKCFDHSMARHSRRAPSGASLIVTP